MVLLIVALLLLANAVFVAAEFALVAVPRTAVEHRAGQGERLSMRVLDGLSSSQQRYRLVATAQFCISVASLGLGMYGQHGLASGLEAVLEPTLGSASF